MNNQVDQQYSKFRGRITKIDKHPIQDNTIVTGVPMSQQSKYDGSPWHAGSNGTYLEFGEYYGVALDITFALYDTQSKFINIKESIYEIPSHLTINIYNELMQALNLQRLSKQKLDQLMMHRGRKVDFIFVPAENTLRHLSDDQYSVVCVCAMPFMVHNNPLIVNHTMFIRKVH